MIELKELKDTQIKISELGLKYFSQLLFQAKMTITWNPIKKGHYWGIKIEKYVEEEEVFIGIARKVIDLYIQPNTTGHFYDYICLCVRKFGAFGQITYYGFQAQYNDTIRDLFEFRNGIGTLSFYRNGVRCGEKHLTI